MSLMSLSLRERVRVRGFIPGTAGPLGVAPLPSPTGRGSYEPLHCNSRQSLCTSVFNAKNKPVTLARRGESVTARDNSLLTFK